MYEPIGTVKCIVIHHSTEDFIGEVAANARVLDLKGRSRGFDAISYHFVIGNGAKGYYNIEGKNHAAESKDGGIEIGRPLDALGAHAIPNEGAIGICLVGNFNRWLPTAKQIRSLEDLVLNLLYHFNLSPESVLGHCEYQDTSKTRKRCPGANFDMEKFRQRLADRFNPDDKEHVAEVTKAVEDNIRSTPQTLKS